MAKREFYKKEEVAELFSGWQSDLECLDIITEQEIVKPYLEKLKTDISNMNCYTARFPDWTEDHVNKDDI